MKMQIGDKVRYTTVYGATVKGKIVDEYRAHGDDYWIVQVTSKSAYPYRQGDRADFLKKSAHLNKREE